MRGLKFHNHIAAIAQKKLTSLGCHMRSEFPIQLPDGQFNFVDLLAEQDGIKLIIEIETTLRNLISNVRKATLSELPMWIIVPNHTLRDAAGRLLWRYHGVTNKFPKILLISDIERQKRLIFPDRRLISRGESSLGKLGKQENK